MAELATHWSSSRPAPIISSFRAEALEAARAAAPERLFGYLIEQLPPHWADEAKRLGCAYVHADTRSLTRDQARAVKERGLTLIVWTVNDSGRGRELLSWGADALITDRPAGLAAELG